jgi:polyhydroxybutyrate depolymerase
MNQRLGLGAGVLLATVLALPAPALEQARKTVSKEIEVGDRKRTFLLHVPPALPKGKPVPLVLAFHGGGATGAGTERLTRFSDLADREGFLVAYPDGVGKNWYDGREMDATVAHKNKIDDVAFVNALIDAISKEHPVDPKRIYATGISNGGIFSHYLAANLPKRIAAIAPVVGGLADPFHQKFKPEKPVSVLIIQGKEDPLVPYDGGGVLGGRRGKIVSTAAAVKKWVELNGCAGEPVVTKLPDRDPRDGCTVTRSTWAKGKDGTEVVLLAIDGGGHTWPSGPQYLPERTIGKVCRDFDGTEVIWEFFKSHPKP